MTSAAALADYRNLEFIRYSVRTFSLETLITAAINVHRIPPSDTLTTTEAAAAEAAAAEAGEYLMAIGKTDFADMTEEERDEFVRRLIIAYRRHFIEALIAQPPF